ncbi:hypothetical protein DID98_28450 [Burkholderia sp. Bp8984]|nr:hypothetical protein DID98_28450 [Burkholderia sp. Bp8984]
MHVHAGAFGRAVGHLRGGLVRRFCGGCGRCGRGGAIVGGRRGGLRHGLGCGLRRLLRGGLHRGLGGGLHRVLRGVRRRAVGGVSGGIFDTVLHGHSRHALDGIRRTILRDARARGSVFRGRTAGVLDRAAIGRTPRGRRGKRNARDHECAHRRSSDPVHTSLPETRPGSGQFRAPPLKCHESGRERHGMTPPKGR